MHRKTVLFNAIAALIEIKAASRLPIQLLDFSHASTFRKKQPHSLSGFVLVEQRGGKSRHFEEALESLIERCSQ